MGILLLTLLGATTMVYLPAGVAGSTVPPCTAAKAMVDARRMTSAVRLFDGAREAGLPCGSGRAARSARATLAKSAAINLSAEAAETRGRDTVALRRYLRASRLDADNTDAASAASRLVGLDAPTPSPSPSASPTPSPFAPAEELEKLGQQAEAEEQALEAVKKGATPSPDSVGEDLVQVPGTERRWNGVVDWMTTWWVAIGTFLVVAALLLAVAAKTRTVRRLTDRRPLTWIPPRLRLKVEAAQASGTDPDLSAGFGVRVQSQVADLTARLQHDPRIVYGADTALAVPMDAAPSQAKYLMALWEWFTQSNTVTAKATLLPPSQRGLGCHVALVERNGAVTRGADPSQQLLMFRPSQWNFDVTATMSTLAWMPLANITTAWTLFAFRSLRAGPTRLADEFGTPSSSAYGEMLSGLEFIAGDPHEAATRFRTALDIDEEFLEAELNLASVLANGSEEDLVEAETILKLQVIQRLETPPPLGDLSHEDPRQVRERALWYRAMYVLAVVKINLLTTGLEVPPPSQEQSTAFDELTQVIDLLLSRIE